MDYRKLFLVEPGKKLKLADIDPGYHGKKITEDHAKAETEKYRATISSLQDLMYSEGHHSLLIILQAMDAGGKDGTVRHAMSTMNPIGTVVTSFKQPTTEDLKHDFLWRVHPHAPARGQVAIFNRSHYEDVLVVRVHNLVPKRIWSKRYRVHQRVRETSLAREQHAHPEVLPLHQPAKSNWRASRTGLTIRRATGRSAKTTTASANSGTTTFAPTKLSSTRPAPTTLPGTLSPLITSGFAISPSRRSWPQPSRRCASRRPSHRSTSSSSAGNIIRPKSRKPICRPRP